MNDGMAEYGNSEEMVQYAVKAKCGHEEVVDVSKHCHPVALSNALTDAEEHECSACTKARSEEAERLRREERETARRIASEDVERGLQEGRWRRL